jgi:hypothetical protein
MATYRSRRVETVEAYQLPVEADDPAAFAAAVEAFHQWADRVGLRWESERHGTVVIHHPNFGPLTVEAGDWIVGGSRPHDFHPVKAADFAERWVAAPEA